MNDCNHEGDEENRMAIYHYPSAAVGFTLFKQHELSNCITSIFKFIAKASGYVMTTTAAAASPLLG